jgi:phenylacetate-coenzyme A ligase PaaK-like adenylate-forming protein
MSDYETLRQRHVAEFQQRGPEYLERIAWPEERLRHERERLLRALIRAAVEHSPWHRKRLTDVDPERVTEADLPNIPPMTKDDLMANFDGIVTDHRLDREIVEAHLAGLTDDAYLLDEFHAVSSGGSSGTRGIFVYGWDAWMVGLLTMTRFRVAHQISDPELRTKPVAAIAAGKATHMTFAQARTFRSDRLHVTPIPATLPLPEIVDRLNALQPGALSGYPSMLYALAREAEAGRLHVTPRIIGPNSEPLLPEMRRAFEEVWRCPILNVYGTSEGVSAASCGKGRGMHLGEDVAIFEPVDGGGRAVPPGVRAAGMYVTNLYNTVLPLIRYELTDEVTLLDEPCVCGSKMRRIDDIEGRTDDVFTYRGGVVVHPLVFRSVLGAERAIIEYQVRQTETGADIFVRSHGSPDLGSLEAGIERQLAASGLGKPVVKVQTVDAFDRQATGKLKRFVPSSPPQVP